MKKIIIITQIVFVTLIFIQGQQNVSEPSHPVCKGKLAVSSYQEYKTQKLNREKIVCYKSVGVSGSGEYQYVAKINELSDEMSHWGVMWTIDSLKMVINKTNSCVSNCINQGAIKKCLQEKCNF